MVHSTTILIGELSAFASDFFIFLNREGFTPPQHLLKSQGITTASSSQLSVINQTVADTDIKRVLTYPGLYHKRRQLNQYKGNNSKQLIEPQLTTRLS
jgi:hypothetical protein